MEQGIERSRQNYIRRGEDRRVIRCSRDLCVCLLFLSRCMRPEGPWQQLAAAFADNDLSTPHYMTRNLSPTTVGYAGAPLSPPSRSHPTKGEDIKGTKERDKGENYNLGRAWPVLFTLLPRDLLSVPALVHFSPGRLRRRPTSHPRALQKSNHRPDSVVLPEPSQRWRPRMLPPAAFPHSPPQLPDLRGPCLALREQMMPRLSLPRVAPPTVTRHQPLGP